MNPNENESAWEDLGYVRNHESQQSIPARSDRAKEFFDEVRRMLGKKKEHKG